MKKNKTIKKISYKKALFIMATWPFIIAGIIGFSYLAYNRFEKKYFESVALRDLKTSDVNQKGIKLSNQEFAKIVNQLEIDEDFSKYSAQQIFDLLQDPQSNFRLIYAFNLANFSSRFPFLKLNITPINKKDVENNNALTTKVVNNNLTNVLFTAHDQFTNKVYTQVAAIRGFTGKGDVHFVDFNLDQQKSALVLKSVEIPERWNALSFKKALNSDYKITKNALKTMEKFGNFSIVDVDDTTINFPTNTRFDFQTDKNGDIIFKNLDDSSGNLWVSFNLFDKKNQKIRSFDLKVLNLINYNQVANFLSNFLKNQDDFIVLKDEKLAEIVGKNVTLSEFFIGKENLNPYFDISKLNALFTNSAPNFNLKLFAADNQMDRLGTVDIVVQLAFGEKNVEKTEEIQQPQDHPKKPTSPKTSTNKNVENSSSKNINESENFGFFRKNQIKLFQAEKSENTESEKNSQIFSFVFTLNPFQNLPKRYLDFAIDQNDYFLVKQEFNYLNGNEIINNLRSINAAFLTFRENKDTSSGYEIINFEDAPSYDSQTHQAIAKWLEEYFKNMLEFPSWKNNTANKIPEKVLAGIFAKMNNITNSKQIFSYGVKYNLFFNSLHHELAIEIIIHDKNSKILAQKIIKIVGFAASTPALLVAKQNSATFFFDGSSGFNFLGEKSVSNPKNITNLKSITNPQIILNPINSNSTPPVKNIEISQTPEFLYPNLSKQPLKFGYKNGENEIKDFNFDKEKPFFYAFSLQNNLENGKSKVVLSFSSKQDSTPPNQEDQVVWIKKVSSKSEIKKDELKQQNLPDDQPLWVVGFGKKNTMSDETNNVIAVLPVSKTNFTDFLLAYFPTDSTGSNHKTKFKISTSKNQQISLNESKEIEITTSSSTNTQEIKLILGNKDEENSSESSKTELLFRFFTQFEYKFSDNTISDTAFKNSLKSLTS
ncbi:P110/LppT family adhesin N-terminal domain [Mycoplasma sp. 'Moose RK']|uniref:P110/LppT family adhesin N-terminal domain n=1 Tax=Mycoplasma sp. 'Moose RK' TaxID=2780095 RepID=UPI0018C2D713|nr:P110/LppT family adhesin N-terminal domain [Mycoplasma sp. 'Moose RK']MBG0731009.1 P110/LppT family adhesin N-terminal domain [Mycoplasma sp. 'Moose RK']